MNKFFAFISCLSIAFVPATASAMGSAPDRGPGRTHEVAEPKDADLGLEQAYHLALRLSEEIAIRDEAVERVTGDTWEAFGDAIGGVDYVYTDRRQHSPESSSTGSSDSSSAVGSLTSRTRSEGKLVLTQPLFRGLREIAAIQGAGSLRQQRIWEKKQARNDLFLEVADAYYGLIRARERNDTVERILSLIGERINDLTEREAIGRSRSSERVTASARKRVLEAGYAQVKGELAIAEYRFTYYTGADPNTNRLTDSGDADTPDPEASLDPAAAAESRPDVRAAREAMQTTRSAITVEQSVLFPTADVTANLYNKREGSQKDIEWDVEFAFDVPLFDGGTGFGRLKKALSDYQTVKLEYQMARRLAEIDVKARWENWRASRDRYEALKGAVAESEENFKLQKDEYTRSLVSNLDVLAALENLLEAQRDEIDARYDMKMNRWRYEIARGECCESL